MRHIAMQKCVKQAKRPGRPPHLLLISVCFLLDHLSPNRPLQKLFENEAGSQGRGQDTLGAEVTENCVVVRKLELEADDFECG